MNSDLLIADLKRDEGIRLKPYRDSVGKLSIGTGRNLDDVGISPEESDFLLANDIAVACRSLDQALPWWRKLPEPQSRALANMAFNMGVPRLLGFRKMLTALRLGEYENAAAEALSSLWADQVGDRAKRIATLLLGN